MGGSDESPAEGESHLKLCALKILKLEKQIVVNYEFDLQRHVSGSVISFFHTPFSEEIVLSPQALGLLSMLEGGVEKGEEWPKIAGPKESGRVCVVGAGPAGLHMALRLKQKGYTKVDILEKTFRVGGKCEDIAHGGVPNPQGGVFAVASYFKNFIKLAEKYGVGEVVKLPSQNVWATNSASDPGSKLSTAAFLFGTLSQITNSSSPEVNLEAIFEVCF